MGYVGLLGYRARRTRGFVGEDSGVGKEGVFGLNGGMLGMDCGVCCGSCSCSGVEGDRDGGLAGLPRAGLALDRGESPSRRRLLLYGCFVEVGDEDSVDAKGERERGSWESWSRNPARNRSGWRR